jgi:hypothetical protein
MVAADARTAVVFALSPGHDHDAPHARALLEELGPMPEGLPLLMDRARIALRTQRIVAHETGATNTTDSVGGSEYIENLTDAIEDGVKRILDEIEKPGKTLSAIETRWVQQQIHNAAYDHQRAVESGTQVVVDRLEGESPPGWEMASTL